MIISTHMKNLRKHYIALAILNALAIPDTMYLTYMHYKPLASTICNLGEHLNCDIVNKSTYSELFGIPVSIFGFITYLILMTFAIRGLMKKNQNKWIPHFTAFIGFGVLFSLYLSGVEAFVLKTWCLFCITQQIIIFTQFGVFLHMKKLIKKS